MTALDRTPTANRALRPWQDPALAVADRVEALLAELTLEEKIGQLGSRWVGNDMSQAEEPEPGAEPLNVAPPCRTSSPPPAPSRWRRPPGTGSAT
ncbi:hypothetical protein GCM10020001_090220 [Nonomuraea salmonea]